MLTELESPQSRAAAPWLGWLMRFVGWLVMIYLAWLGVITALRVAFPWDLFAWPESPFMTNMLKLDQGQPIFTSPADANSFVYSPGLEYLTFALLKPLGLHLDIRYCRLVNVFIGLSTGCVAGLAFVRALAFLAPGFRSARFSWLGAGVAVLVIFRNFTADVTHPDNLVMFHTTLLFLLTLWALEQRSYRLALLTMAFAGSGVFAKQILMVSFIGPALLFARHNFWGWRKWAVLAALGALASLAALGLLWSQPFARFYTFEVLSRQGIRWTQLYWIVQDSMHADRAVLWILGLVSLSWLWSAGSPGRRYLEIWLALGICSVWPNAVSYLKLMGTWNNLIIFQLWLLLLVWPALGQWLHQSGSTAQPGANPDLRFNLVVGGLLALFILLLLPARLPPNRAMYATCASIQERVSDDIHAGRKVLVAHGTMYQIRAGSRAIPLDRANSCLELGMAGLADRTHTAARIRARPYDRIYLTVPEWYDPAVLSELEKNYVVEQVIPKPRGNDRLDLGRNLGMIGDCQILSRRKSIAEGPVDGPFVGGKITAFAAQSLFGPSASSTGRTLGHSRPQNN